jgi:hypothetical protein
MVISLQYRRTALYLFGMLILTPALFMAQVFWGVYLAFAVLSAFSPPSAAVVFFLLSLSGAVSAALPFGVLFGIASPAHARRNAVLFAAIPAVLVFGFGVWVSVWVSPLPLNHPIWSVRASDALLFAILFPFFAALGARLGSRRSSVLRFRLASVMFCLVAAGYAFVPQFYYRYVYVAA